MRCGGPWEELRREGVFANPCLCIWSMELRNQIQDSGVEVYGSQSRRVKTKTSEFSTCGFESLLYPSSLVDLGLRCPSVTWGSSGAHR